MAKLSRINRFEFIGELKYGKETVATRQLGESKWKSTRANVMVKDGENAQFLNVEYMHCDDISTTKIMTSKGEMVDVDLSMTNTPEVIKNCADFVKTVVDLETDFEKKKEYVRSIFRRRNHLMKKEDEQTQEDLDKIAEYTKEIEEKATNRHEFAHMKDVIKFLEDNKELLDGKKVRVRGNVKANYYKGNTTLQYVPSEIELVDAETLNMTRAEVDFFFEKAAMEDDKKGKKAFITGYILERVKKADKLMPVTLVIDYTKIDLENPDHVMLLDFLKGIFEVKDRKQIHKMGIMLNVISGREQVEFDESMLTAQQKMCITLGMNSVDDFKPRGGNTYGEKIQELRVINGNFKEYPEGAIEVFATSELDDYLVQTQEEIKEQQEEEIKTEEIVQADKIANLFG